MKSWKVGVATLALCVGVSGVALAQDRDWHQDQRTTEQRHDRGQKDRAQWHNDQRHNGYYGQRRGDDDRDGGYRNGRYAYPGNYGYQGNYGYGRYGYPANSGYPGNYGYGRGGYGNPAAQFGYQDGFRYGQMDASRGKGFNATGSEYYENADHGYNSSFGNKSEYRQEYRSAYQQGYQTGYQSGGGFGRGR